MIVGSWVDGLVVVGQRPGRLGRIKGHAGPRRQAGRGVPHLRDRRRQGAAEDVRRGDRHAVRRCSVVSSSGATSSTRASPTSSTACSGHAAPAVADRRIRSVVPRAHARELVDGDAHHQPRRRVVHRRELHVRARGTRAPAPAGARARRPAGRWRCPGARGTPASPSRWCREPPPRATTRGSRSRLRSSPERTEGREHHLVAVEPDPHAAHLRRPVGVHRDHVGEVRTFEDLTRGVGEGDHPGRVERQVPIPPGCSRRACDGSAWGRRTS